jgi:putative inorganic carbon (HCO3(-)) transporter
VLMGDSVTLSIRLKEFSSDVADPGEASISLSLAVFLTLATAPIEGYLAQVHGGLTKAAPTLLAVVWTIHLVRHVRIPNMTPMSWLVVALTACLATSIALNSANDRTFLMLYSFRWLPFMVITIILIDVLGRYVSMRGAVVAIILGGAISGTGAVFSFYVAGEKRAQGPLSDPNDLAYVLMAAVPFALLAWSPRRADIRLFRVIVAACLLSGAALTFSRGALVAALFGTIWGLCRRIVAWRALVLGVALATIGGFVAWSANAARLQSAYAQKEFVASGNVDAREIKWAAAVRLLPEHPLFGAGPGGARQFYMAASHNAELSQQTPVIHNMYFEVAAELGIVGFAIFLAIIVYAFFCSERMFSNGNPVGLAVQGSLVMICSASFFLSEEYFLALWSAVAIASSSQRELL